MLSRSHLFTFEPLQGEEIERAIETALANKERGLGARGYTIDAATVTRLASFADGDPAEHIIFETIVEALPMGGTITDEEVAAFAAERGVRDDRGEDEHYDTASAFIKSMRGNDPDAALYWLAKMLAGGEDPRFIARRLVIFASEDVGLADSRALLLADSCFRACETIGLPECELNLAHVTLFLTTCPKSNSATLALSAAKRALRENPTQPVPPSIRDMHGRNKKYRDENAERYRYSHDYPENVSGQDYLKARSNCTSQKLRERKRQ